MEQSITFDNQSIFYLTEKKTLPGIYAYCLYDYHTKKGSEHWVDDLGRALPRQLVYPKDKLKDTDGFPQMVPFSPRNGVRLDERIQWFILAQNVWSRYRIDIFEEVNAGRVITVKEKFYKLLSKLQQAAMKETWRQMFRDDTAFSNHSGVWNKKKQTEDGNTGVDYIRETSGRGYGLPRMWELGAGGSTYLVNQKIVNPTADFIELKVLRASDYHVWYNWKYDDPRYRCFFTYATNITPFLIGTKDTFTRVGPWKVDPFHMNGGAHVIYPAMSESGTVKVEIDRVSILFNIKDYPYPYTQ